MLVFCHSSHAPPAAVDLSGLAYSCGGLGDSPGRRSRAVCKHERVSEGVTEGLDGVYVFLSVCVCPTVYLIDVCLAVKTYLSICLCYIFPMCAYECISISLP